MQDFWKDRMSAEGGCGMLDQVCTSRDDLVESCVASGDVWALESYLVAEGLMDPDWCLRIRRSTH